MLKELLTSAALLFLLQEAGAAPPAPEPVRLYGVEFTRADQKLAIAQETFNAIRRAVAPRPLLISSVPLQELDRLVEEHRADIVITISGVYRRHLRNGMRDIATLITRDQPDPDHAVGSVLYAPEGSGIRTLEDLRGKRIALNHPNAFQGTLTIKKELLDRGYDPEHFFSTVLYLGTDWKTRFEAVKNGVADATFGTVCLKERAKGKEAQLLSGFAPVAARQDPRTGCYTSTELYPNHTILISPSLDVGTIRKIADAVYRMPPNAAGEHWMLASDFGAVDNLYRSLKLGPYEHLRSWTLARIWNEYRLWILPLLAALLFGLWHVLRTGQLVRTATRELREALARERELTSRVRDLTQRYEGTRRALTVGSISSIVAHEMGQPLSAMLFYAKSLRKLIAEKASTHGFSAELMLEAADELIAQNVRANSIISLVRGIAKEGKSAQTVCDLYALSRRSTDNFILAHPESRKAISFEAPKGRAPVLLSELGYELALSNLVKNSWESVSGMPRPRIRVACRPCENGYEVRVEDNGPGMPEAQLRQMNSPVRSLKSEGLGLGLSIVRAVVTESGGTLSIGRGEKEGLCVRVTIPGHTGEDNEA